MMSPVESELFTIHCSIEESLETLKTLWHSSLCRFELTKSQHEALCIQVLHNYIKHRHPHMADQLNRDEPLDLFIKKLLVFKS